MAKPEKYTPKRRKEYTAEAPSHPTQRQKLIAVGSIALILALSAKGDELVERVSGPEEISVIDSTDSLLEDIEETLRNTSSQ